MAYTILVRKIDRSETMRRDATDTIHWFLETYHTDDSEVGVVSVNLDRTNDPLIVVLSDLEVNKGVKLIGTDGPNRFILHKPNPPRVGLRNC